MNVLSLSPTYQVVCLSYIVFYRTYKVTLSTIWKNSGIKTWVWSFLRKPSKELSKEYTHPQFVLGTDWFNLRYSTACTSVESDWPRYTPAQIQTASDAIRTLLLWDTCFGHAQNYTHSGQRFSVHSLIFVKKRIEPDPVISVFRVTPSNSGLSKHHSDFIAFSTLLAHRLILFGWKSTTPPSHSRWVREVMAFLNLEKIRCTIQGSVKRFKKNWCVFLEYFTSESDATTLDQ